MTDANNLAPVVAGARLSKGGLHLGHLFGNLTPGESLSADTPYVFIIKDTEPYIWPSPEEKGDALVQMAADVLAASPMRDVRVVVASGILRASNNLYATILDSVQLNHLQGVHLKKAEICGKKRLSLRNLLYPVDEAAITLALGATHVVANDDNSRLVCFTRDVAKRVRRRVGVELTKPDLLHNDRGGRLLGLDYRRMCKSYENAVQLAVSPSALADLCYAAASPRRFFDYSADSLLEHRLDPPNFVYGLDYLPFYLQRMLCGHVAPFEERAQLSRLGRQAVADSLFDHLESILRPIRLKREAILSDPEALLTRIVQDTSDAADVARATDRDFGDCVTTCGPHSPQASEGDRAQVVVSRSEKRSPKASRGAV